MSLLFSCYGDGEAMEKFDRLKDGPVNNFVGSMSLAENLKRVPKKMIDFVRTIDLDDAVLFQELEKVKLSSANAVPFQYWDCVGKMIRERRDTIEKIFDQG